MKKILFVLLALLAVSAFAVGGSSAPTAPTVNAPLQWSIERDATSFTADTTVSVDSTTLLSLYGFKEGYRYILECGALTGTASTTDSVKIQVRVDLYNSSKTFIRSILIDTLGDHNGKAIVLPIGQTAWAPYVTIKAVAYGAANGTQIIFPAGWMTIWKVSPFTRSKLWQ